MKIDIAFRVSSTGTIPADHGYLLYAALSRKLPYLHESLDVGVHPIRGRQLGDRRMALQDFSRVTVHADVEAIRHFIPLSGSSINLAGTSLLLGVPELRQLEPAPDLRCRLVVIKLSHSPTVPEDAFLKSLTEQLQALDVTPDEVLLGDRRTLRIKDCEVVGYEVCLAGLTAAASVRVQEQGLGGRHRMGCGMFATIDAAQWKATRARKSKEATHG